jgi:hypothetical protein
MTSLFSYRIPGDDGESLVLALDETGAATMALESSSGCAVTVTVPCDQLAIMAGAIADLLGSKLVTK